MSVKRTFDLYGARGFIRPCTKSHLKSYHEDSSLNQSSVHWLVASLPSTRYSGRSGRGHR